MPEEKNKTENENEKEEMIELQDMRSNDEKQESSKPVEEPEYEYTDDNDVIANIFQKTKKHQEMIKQWEEKKQQEEADRRHRKIFRNAFIVPRGKEEEFRRKLKEEREAEELKERVREAVLKITKDPLKELPKLDLDVRKVLMECPNKKNHRK